MRQQHLFMPTLREEPSDAETASHMLMLRAGLIRPLAAGVYTYLPLGLKVLRNLQHIIRQELDAAGAQELLMPAMQPAELWTESGRYDVYGPELIKFRDRHQREFALGPTHEEVITSLVRDEIQSYRKLPVTLYQIQTKFRDERRPRFGLLRGREFLMKDAYSFDTDLEGLDRSYWKMYRAYERIFTRAGLNYRAVEGAAGAIGGEGGTHEFMALADIGEDTLVSCGSCGYAANLELAVSQESQGTDQAEAAKEFREVREGEHCVKCGSLLTLTRGIEIGHVFKLGTKYSAKLGAVFTSAAGKEQAMLMGCYGIGVSRLLSAIVEQRHDEQGILWPEAIAPFRVHIVLVSAQDERQVHLADRLYEQLLRRGIETLLDDRDERAGVKLKEADLLGCPIRIVVGKAAADGQVEYKKRHAAEVRLCGLEEALRLCSLGE